MYAGKYATQHPDRPAFIMASTGEAVSYRDYDARTNQLAHLLRSEGLKRLDHYAIFMENNNRYLESCGAGERSGLYYTCVNSFLTADELAYILNNSESRVLITSRSKLEVALKALEQCPQIGLCLVTEGAMLDTLPAHAGQARVMDYASAVASQPPSAIADEALGTPMLYSSCSSCGATART
jgi:long-chain acyl-CoA synthetase